MILSMGSSIRIPASTAVKPRFMPCPSIDIFGGRYLSLRRRSEVIPHAISPAIPPKQSNGMMNGLAQAINSPKNPAPPVEPDGEVPAEPVTMESSEIYCFGKEAPKMYWRVASAEGFRQV